MGCINEANFKQYRLQNEKYVKWFFFIDLTINCCIYTVQKGYLDFDCRNI